VGTGYFKPSSTETTIPSSSVTVADYPTNTITIEACKDTSTLPLNSSPTGSVTLKQITVPYQKKTSDSIQVSLYADSDLTNTIASGSFTIADSSITTGSITLTSFEPSDSDNTNGLWTV
jgi:hypothetical protein